MALIQGYEIIKSKPYIVIEMTGRRSPSVHIKL